MAKMQEYQVKSKGKVQVTLNDVNDLQSLPRVRTRGRPKNRLGSNMEKKIANVTKKKKKLAPSELYAAQDMNDPRKDYRSFSFY
ncbi:hypothetical protein Ahy_A03g012898 isoform B [Arachis hypogaea]|uniref:Uncharacterized protein n=1 Tax=Arachis hypogaea TaxID=3818 RepID=A0A445DUE7_ARAHY|nr:hypothetical protein Ahy_A03g012898 isoform B [Arachis hypogaea]